MAANVWGGIIPPLVTPLLDQDVLDREGLERLIEHVIAGGVSGIFILGTTGEGPSLSYALRAEVIRETCHMARGRVPVLACISDTSFGESARLAGIAADAGVAALVTAAPYYLYCTQPDLLNYVTRLADETPVPMFIYNMPRLTKVGFDIETVRAASDNPKIVGFKDSSGDLVYLKKAIDATRHRPGFATFIGPEESLADGIRIGCAGGVSGGANLNPKLFVGIHQAASRGDWATADEFQLRSRVMSKAIYNVGDPATSYMRGLKGALGLHGLCRDTLALPLLPFSETEKATLAANLAAFGDLEVLAAQK